MNQKAIITIFILLSSAVVKAQTIKKEQVVVQHTIENMFAAISLVDTVLLKTFVSSNIRFYEYGEVWTLDTLIKKLLPNKSIPDFKRTNLFKYVNTTVQKNTAWVTYYLQSVFYANGKEEMKNWMETVVLIKENKQWKVEVLHSTRLVKN